MAKAAKVCYRLTAVLAILGIKPENYESSRGNFGNYRVIRNQDDDMSRPTGKPDQLARSMVK